MTALAYNTSCTCTRMNNQVTTIIRSDELPTYACMAVYPAQDHGWNVDGRQELNESPIIPYASEVKNEGCNLLSVSTEHTSIFHTFVDCPRILWPSVHIMVWLITLVVWLFYPQHASLSVTLPCMQCLAVLFISAKTTTTRLFKTSEKAYMILSSIGNSTMISLACTCISG